MKLCHARVTHSSAHRHVHGPADGGLLLLLQCLLQRGFRRPASLPHGAADEGRRAAGVHVGGQPRGLGGRRLADGGAAAAARVPGVRAARLRATAVRGHGRAQLLQRVPAVPTQ